MKKLIVLFLTLISFPVICQAAFFSQENTFEGQGYVGTLPDLTKSFRPTEPVTTKPVFEASQDFNSANEIKPIPKDDPAFVNIILKDNKTSPYLNDIIEILTQLENLLLCIENRDNVQIFNAKAYFFNKTIEFFRDKYQDMPESSFISYQKLMELSTYTQSVATLRAEAEKYRPYLAYTGAGYLYNDNVIDQQLEYLKQEIEDTIVILKEVH